MKKNRVYTVNSLLARISGNYKFWLIALPAVTMLAQAPAVYALSLIHISEPTRPY